MNESMNQEPVMDKVVMDLVNAPKTCPICGRWKKSLMKVAVLLAGNPRILPYK